VSGAPDLAADLARAIEEREALHQTLHRENTSQAFDKWLAKAQEVLQLEARLRAAGGVQ
jgi:hypothetical protein